MPGIGILIYKHGAFSHVFNPHCRSAIRDVLYKCFGDLRSLYNVFRHFKYVFGGVIDSSGGKVDWKNAQAKSSCCGGTFNCHNNAIVRWNSSCDITSIKKSDFVYAVRSKFPRTTIRYFVCVGFPSSFFLTTYIAIVGNILPKSSMRDLYSVSDTQS